MALAQLGALAAGLASLRGAESPAACSAGDFHPRSGAAGDACPCFSLLPAASAVFLSPYRQQRQDPTLQHREGGMSKYRADGAWAALAERSV